MEIYGQIKIEAPLEFVTVTGMEFCQEAGEHARLELCGFLKESAEGDGICVKADSCVEVWVSGGKTLLFSGVPVSVRVRHGERPEAVLAAAGRSILLDVEKKSRSFQRKTMNDTELMREIVTENGGEFMARERKEESISAPFIQYKETDWQFLKRLASCYGSELFVGAEGRKPQIYLGLGENGDERVEKPVCRLEKQVEEYARFREKAGAVEQDFLQCEVTSREKYAVGDRVGCLGTTLLITGIRARLEHGELRYTYRLAQKEGLYREESRSRYVQGRTLLGRVLARENNRVKIHLNIDARQEESDAYCYPLAGTDWYCMPEEGSTAALYIPSDNEKEAYVTGLRRIDGEKNEKTQDPDERRMETADGKGMETTPKSISLHLSGDGARMELTERDGIKVKSREGICLKTGDSFTCRGETVTVEGGDRVVLHTDRTALVLDDLIQVKG